MELSTPGILFAAISLLLLGYADRFSEVAKLIRQLLSEESNDNFSITEQQLFFLKKRLKLIRITQIFGVISYVLCGCSLFALLLKNIVFGEMLFSLAVFFLLLTLLSGFREIWVSTKALNIIINNHYKKIQNEKANKK